MTTPSTATKGYSVRLVGLAPGRPLTEVAKRHLREEERKRQLRATYRPERYSRKQFVRDIMGARSGNA